MTNFSRLPVFTHTHISNHFTSCTYISVGVKLRLRKVRNRDKTKFRSVYIRFHILINLSPNIFIIDIYYKYSYVRNKLVLSKFLFVFVYKQFTCPCHVNC